MIGTQLLSAVALGAFLATSTMAGPLPLSHAPQASGSAVNFRSNSAASFTFASTTYTPGGASTTPASSPAINAIVANTESGGGPGAICLGCIASASAFVTLAGPLTAFTLFVIGGVEAVALSAAGVGCAYACYRYFNS